MYRINFKKKISDLTRVSKSTNHNHSHNPVTPHTHIITKYQYYTKATLFSRTLSLCAAGASVFALSFHLNESIREALKPYLPQEVERVLHDYIGPNSIANIQQKLENISILNKIPWFSNGTIKTGDNGDKMTGKVKTAFQREKDLRKVAEKSDSDDAAEDEKIQQLNTDFTSNAKKLLMELELSSKRTAGFLVGLESKINEHSKKLKVAIEDDGTSKDGPWDEANAVAHQQQTLKVKSDNEIKKLQLLMTKLEEITKSGLESENLKRNPSIKLIEEALTNTKSSVSQLQKYIEKAHFNAQLTHQYKDLIQQGRERFKEELSGLSNNVSSWTKKEASKLSNEDLNALIIHAHRKVYQLQARIADLESMDSLRLKTALAEQRRLHDLAIIEKIKEELDKATSKIESERLMEVEDLTQKGKGALRQALTRQATAHSEHLTQLLLIQREEIEKQHSLSIREALIREREKMSGAIEGWRMRVEGMEAAVEGRADQERLSRESQDLWVACHALQGVLNDSGPTPPLARYVSSFEEAAQSDSLSVVQLLLSSVPSSALTDGVCTQDVLTKRFDKVKKTCDRVAMIDEAGGSLGLYSLSWLRSVFMMSPACLIEPNTLVDPTNSCIDPHLILASAELAMKRRDVDLALRLLNLLRGMPRAVAHDWIEDAHAFLETKLAAEALSSYTSSKTAGSFPVDAV